jgi:hypothetical protein
MASLEKNPALRLAMMEMIDAQLRHNDPPLAKQTYERLLTEGLSDPQTREMLAAAMAYEIELILEKQEPFNRARYGAALKRLPNPPEKE